MPAPPVVSRPVLAAARRGLRRYLSELRASQSYLAGEVSHGGWLDLGQFRWRNVTPGRAARAAFGVLAPLVLGVATGHTEYGVFAALGALPAGMVSFQGVTRTRVLLVAITAAGMAVSTFVGGTTSAEVPWLLVPVIMLWCYVAGVCASLGPAAIAVTLQWPVAVLIASAIPLAPSAALVRAGLVLAGGLWQGALVISSWAFSRGSTERTAMADSYARLSEYASGLAAGHGGPPGPGTLPGTSALLDPNPLLRDAARRHLIDLREEAERIRTTLTVVGAPAASSGQGNQLSDSRQALLEAGARRLSEIAEALRARPSQRGGHLEAAQAQLGPDSRGAGRPWQWAAESLHGQLRSAVRIVQRLNDAEPGRAGHAPRPPVRLPARDMLITLRASLGTSSEAGRHALRLAVVAGGAQLIALAAGLPHGYWVALTVLIVLRPDYSSTVYRGVQRAAGTVLGAGLGLATVQLGHFGSWALLTALGASVFAAYAVFAVNYLFFAIFLTDYVVVLLALLGLPADQTALDRLIGTGVGTGLALAAYILWPTWQRSSASDKFARLFLEQSRFADMMLRAWNRPASPELRSARSGKLAARRARSDAEASADRLADEPDRPPVTREFAQALVSAGHRLALATLALEAAVRTHHAALLRAARPAGGPDSSGPDDVAGLDQAGLDQAGLDQAGLDEPGLGGLALGEPVLGEPALGLADLDGADLDGADPDGADPVGANLGGRGPGEPALGQPPGPAEDGSGDRKGGQGGPDPVQHRLDQLAGLVRQAAVQLAESLRRLGPPAPLPPLREVEAGIPREHDDAAALLPATDSLVDALNTTADILRRHLTPARAQARSGSAPQEPPRPPTPGSRRTRTESRPE